MHDPEHGTEYNKLPAFLMRVYFRGFPARFLIASAYLTVTSVSDTSRGVQHGARHRSA